MNPPLVISYTRFSSIGQADGDSERRQVQSAERYAAKHGLTISDDFRLKDLGKSAYDGTNVDKGALGELVKLIRANRIPQGTMLLVENFDRLSRRMPLDALTLFTEIINAGLVIVTLHDEQVFSRQVLAQNPYMLVGVFMEQIRANSESVTKSKRIKEAWNAKKHLAKTSGKVMTKKAPYWLRAKPDRSGFELIPERAEVVRWLVDEAERGVGHATLIRLLHQNGVEAWSSSGSWQPSYMQKVLTNPALFGGIRLNGEIVKGYYPPLVDEDRFYRLQALRANRRTTQATSGRGLVLSNLFSRRMVCGYCGFAMTITGYKENPRKQTRKGYERKYVGCHGARIGDPQGCKKQTIWFMDELEPMLLLRLTGLNPAQLVGADASALDEARRKLETLVGQQQEVQRRIENVLASLEVVRSKTMSERLVELEAEAELLVPKVAEQQAMFTSLTAQQAGSRNRLQNMVKLFKMMKQAKTPDELKGIRQGVAELISKVVARVTLYPAGPIAGGSKQGRYAVVELRTGEVLEVDDSTEDDEYHDAAATWTSMASTCANSAPDKWAVAAGEHKRALQ